MTSTRPFRITSVQARDVREGMVLTTPGGWHRHVVEVDPTSNAHGQVIIRLANRPGAHPSGSTVLHPDSYLYAVQYTDGATRVIAKDGLVHHAAPGPTGPTTACGRTGQVYVTSDAATCPACTGAPHTS